MKKLFLTHGGYALVDDEDYGLLNNWNWYQDNHGYARGWVDGKHTRLHRLIMSRPKAMVDHINGNRLDNRRSNLRVVSPSQNAINKKIRKDSKTGIRGIRHRQQYNKWQARITKDGKRISLGHFNTKEEAAKAYQKAVPQVYGEYARTS